MRDFLLSPFFFSHSHFPWYVTRQAWIRPERGLPEWYIVYKRRMTSLLLSLFLLPIFSSFMTIIGDCQLWGSWECTESPNSLCKPSGLSRSNWASHRCICCFSQHKSPTEGWLLRVLFHLDNVCWLPISLLVRVPGTGKYNGESSSLGAYMLVEAAINQAPMCMHMHTHRHIHTPNCLISCMNDMNVKCNVLWKQMTLA